MKKSLIVAVFVVALGIAFSSDFINVTPKAIALTPEEEQYNQNEAIKARRAWAEDLISRQKDQRDIEAALAKVPKNEALQRDLEQAKKKVIESKTALKNAEEDTNYQKFQIIEEYKLLIAANKAQGEEIAKAPTIENGGRLSKDTLEKQKKANELYGKFLEAQRDFKLCRVDGDSEQVKALKPGKYVVCNKLEGDVAVAGKAVREILAELTKQEQNNNKEMTFNVTKMLNLKGGDPKAQKLTLQQFTNKVADWMITLVGSLAVTTMIIGGFILVTSAGNETRLETGKTIFTYSLIGVVVTLLAYAMVAFIQSLFFTI